MENYIEQKTEKIENLNLISLRKYACQKINNQKDWFLKCVDCKGLSGCPAGKRALQIIEEQTKPENSSKKYEELVFPFNPQVIAKMRADFKTDHRGEKFFDAFGTNDPAGYLVDKGYFMTRWRANDSLKKFLIRNGVVSKSDVVNKNNKEAREETIKNIQDIARKYTTPEELAKHVSVTWSTIYTWLKKYPDELKGYETQLLGAARILQHARYLEKKECGQSMKEEASEEISIQDFLKESGPEIGKEAEKAEPPKPATDDIPVTIVKHKEGAPKPAPVLSASTEPNHQGILLEEFTKKRHEYKKRIKIIEAQIGELTLAKKELLDKMTMLDGTAELFGMKPVS